MGSAIILAMSPMCNYKYQITVSRTILKPQGKLQEVYFLSRSVYGKKQSCIPVGTGRGRSAELF